VKKKLRKFSDGGYSTVDKENPVPSIDDETRTRAMKYVEGASEESRDIGAPVTRSAAKSTSKISQTSAPAKPKVDEAAEKARMENLTKKQGLETVSPELDFVPAGKIAAGAGALYMGARAIGKRILANRAEKTAAEEVAKTTARIAKNDAAEAAVRSRASKVRSESNDAAETALRVRAAKARGKVNDAASKKVRERAKKQDDLDGFDDGGSGAFKRGGSVKSSASRRADGCAIRGKTRA